MRGEVIGDLGAEEKETIGHPVKILTMAVMGVVEDSPETSGSTRQHLA